MSDLSRVAAFDVDGTLTRRDCVVPFLREVAGTVTLSTRLLRDPARLARASIDRDRDAFKTAAAAAAFSGVPYDELRSTAQAFAERVNRSGLRPDVIESLEQHRREGDRTVLVSASFEIYLDPLAEMLGVDAVLGTRLEVDEFGVLTGRLDGANCRGPEKVRRLHGWLTDEFGGRSEVTVTAYGDSAGDREMLADADLAHWVGPSKAV